MSYGEGRPKTLLELKARCEIDEESRCWEYRKADGTEYAGCPQYSEQDGKVVKTIMRISLELSGVEVPDGMVVRKRPTCVFPYCCNPGHLVAAQAGHGKPVPAKP